MRQLYGLAKEESWSGGQANWYLLSTRGKGFILRPDRSKSFECYVDADYCGKWNPLTTDDLNTAESRSGYVITYLCCPVVWASRLQTIFALSTY
jgi:hypothetical protein